MGYEFLVDTYETEVEKVLSVWTMFDEEDFRTRPHPSDPRGRSPLEHMTHQCVSEDFWFSNMLGISVLGDPMPPTLTRLAFMMRYHAHAQARLTSLAGRPDSWWGEDADFFETRRSRAWIVVRRIAHTAHHRGQQTALLRMLDRNLHSTYGPTADTGGLMRDHAPVIYPYADSATLLAEEGANRRKAPLPGPGTAPSTEFP